MLRKLTVILLTGVMCLVGLTSALAVTYNEAPMLRTMVAAGVLPPVEERLPKNPLVWDFPDVREQEDGIGKYGGTLNVPHIETIKAIATIGFARVTVDRKSYVPDIAESWEFSSDYKTLIFYLREGMKWSDGHPFTADDIMFWWNDIVHSRYIAEPLVAPGMNSQIDKIVKIDDYTLRFEFAEQNANFFDNARGFAGGEVGVMFRSPKHYMKQFHPDYNPKEGVSPEEQFHGLQDLLERPRYLEEADRPFLWAWKIAAYKEGEFLRLERNPYFWVVDTEGNQLPYIDFVECLLLTDEDREVIKLRVLAGAVDWESRSIYSTDVPFLREKGDEAGIEVRFFWMPEGAQQGIFFNWNNPDPDLRAVVRKADFRRALSLAIDRELINEIAHLGFGRAGHGFSPPGIYDPEIDGSWAEYDPDRANKMLDAIGLDKRDSKGYRLLPNGEKFTFTLMFVPGWHEGAVETAEVATECWRKIGIQALAKPVDHKLKNVLKSSETFDAQVYCWVGGLETQLYRYPFEPPLLARSQWAWWQTRSLPADERSGIEPTGVIRRFFELRDIATQSANKDEVAAANDEVRKLMADQILCMGMVQGIPHPIIIAKNLRNVWGSKERILLGAGDEDYWPRSWYWEVPR